MNALQCYVLRSLPVLLNVLSDPLGSRACAEHHSRTSSIHWLECHVNGCAAVGWLPVLQTTFVEPDQTGPPQLTYDTQYRYHVRHKYKQWVISISNVNLVYAGPGGREVWGVCLGPHGCWDRGSNPASCSPNNDSAGTVLSKNMYLCRNVLITISFKDTNRN